MKTTQIFLLGKCRNTKQTKTAFAGSFTLLLVLKKSAEETNLILMDVYGDHVSADQTCRLCFAQFKRGDFETKDKERLGQLKKFEDEEELLEDQCQKQKELAMTFAWNGKIPKAGKMPLLSTIRSVRCKSTAPMFASKMPEKCENRLMTGKLQNIRPSSDEE